MDPQERIRGDILDIKMMEVDFETYCPKCKYKEFGENTNVCCECLEYGYNENSQKPVNFTEDK